MIKRYERKSKLFIRVFSVSIILGFLYLSANLCITYGVLKEREAKNCIKGDELLLWENTLKTAHSICVDVQQNQLSEIKQNYLTRIETAEQEAEKWKSYYLYQKNLSEDNSKSNENENESKAINQE